MKEILKKVRKYEIEIRKYLNNSNQGDYNSIFKGSGIDFDDLRPYQYGDDHRSINWNISAKEDKIYTNTYKEDGTIDVVARVNRWTDDSGVKQYRR